jgi:hypothetical protein
MSESAYTLSNDELLRQFSRASAEAGTSNSGLVIDCGASYYKQRMKYLFGVLLSKLEGKQPPFPEGSFIKPKYGEGIRATNEQGGIPRLLLQDTRQIDEVWYVAGKWEVKIKGLHEFRFSADDFVKVESPEIVAV